MLEMRPDCERCGSDLPAEAPGAFLVTVGQAGQLVHRTVLRLAS